MTEEEKNKEKQMLMSHIFGCELMLGRMSQAFGRELHFECEGNHVNIVDIHGNTLIRWIYDSTWYDNHPQFRRISYRAPYGYKKLKKAQDILIQWVNHTESQHKLLTPLRKYLFEKYPKGWYANRSTAQHN